jgi:glutamyl-tRNA synthetase
LRIEDTDQNRQVEGAVANLLKVMKNLGVEFDEGYYLNDDGTITQRGEYGSYLQSERLPLYHKYVQQLIEQGFAYYCFCDEQRLEELRKEQVALKKPPMYDKHCRYLDKAELETKLNEFKAAGKNPVVRQAIPESGQTVVPDVVYGDMVFDHAVLDDQVLLKSDGFPTYHLAVVVDDHSMEISHVIRGEEWISSTPKHILLYQAFGWQPTVFAHLPLILNTDKSKLSKRQGDVSVEDFLAKGYLKEALLNFVAFLGWNPKTEQEIFSLEELIKEFELTKINKSGAVFDINKLDWLNGLYIRSKPNAELVEMLKPFWQQTGLDVSGFSQKYLEAIVVLEKDRLKKLSEIGERTGYFFQQPDYDGQMLVWKKSDASTTKDVLSQLRDFIVNLDDKELVLPNFENHLKQFITDNGLDNGTVLWPLRVALTGLEKSPGPFEVATTLVIGVGKQEVVSRIERAVGKL